MRVAHKIDIAILAVLLLLLLLLIPKTGIGQTREFGDYIVRYSAISSTALVADVAKTYGIERSSRNGLLNVAVQKRRDGDAELIGAKISGTISDLTGHSHPIAFRETKEGGDIDYLGEFPVDGSGTYLFTVSVLPAGGTQNYTLKFNQDYVVD